MKIYRMAAALILGVMISTSTLGEEIIRGPINLSSISPLTWPRIAQVMHRNLLDRLDTLAEVAEIIGNGHGDAGEGEGYLTVYEVVFDMAAALRGEMPFSVVASSKEVMSVLEGYNELASAASMVDDPGYSRSRIASRVEDVIEGMDLLSSAIRYRDVFEDESYGWKYEAGDLYEDLLDFVDTWKIEDLIDDDIVSYLYDEEMPEEVLAEDDVPTLGEVRNAYAEILMERIYEDIDENFYHDIVESSSYSFDEFQSTIDSTVSRLDREIDDFTYGRTSRSDFKSILEDERDDLERLSEKYETLIETIEYYYDLISDMETASEAYGYDIDWDDLCDKLF